MHDPMVVAFEIPVPFPRRDRWSSKRDSNRMGRFGLYRRRRTNPENLGEPVYRWWRPVGWTLRAFGCTWRMASLATVWHVEPGGRDSGEVCRHHICGDAWRSTPRWKVRLNPFVKPVDGGKWAADRSWKWHVWHWHIQVHPLQRWRARLFDRCAECGRKGSPNFSHGWGDAKIGWRKWRSRPGLYHHECSSLVHLRRQRDQDEELICSLFSALRVERDESEQDTLAWLTDAHAQGLEFSAQRRLWMLLGYERDESYKLVKAGVDQ